jgi:hypothetical protein
MRASGQYAVVAGEQLSVIGRSRDAVTVDPGSGPRHVAIADLDDLLKVLTTASWDGEEVVVNGVGAATVGVLTHSRALAESRGLHGDQYGGWSGEAPIEELSNVQERVVSIHPGRSA